MGKHTVKAAPICRQEIFFPPAGQEDVYKRQQYPDLYTSQERYFSPQGRTQLHLHFPSPVSYTHLDVYKRQRET